MVGEKFCTNNSHQTKNKVQYSIINQLQSLRKNKYE